jgi:hypothetical protein
MTKSDKTLTSEYLDWHAKLSGLPSILTDKIRSNLYKKYKKETGHEPWQLFKVLLINNNLSCLFNFKEPEDATLSVAENVELDICLGYTPVKMFHPGRKARLFFPEVEDNPIPPNVRTANIVVKVLRLIPKTVRTHNKYAQSFE